MKNAARRQAEDNMREREAFSRSVLDAVEANIAVLDRNGVITAVNHAWQEFARNNGDASGGAATTPGGPEQILQRIHTTAGYSGISLDTTRSMA